MKVDNIDLRLLRVFHALAKSGGFAGAQAELGLAPSTLSIHLSNLEQRLGVVLCERGRGGFRLTEAGERVHAATKRLFDALDDFQQETAGLRGRLMGELTIGLVDSIVTDARSPISAAIRRFCERDHDVHLRLIVDRPQALNHALLEGRLNLAVAGFPHRLPAIAYEELYEENNLLYCARGHELFGVSDAAAGPEHVARARFVARRQAVERDLAAIDNVSYQASVENVEAQAHLILSGAYIGFLPEHYAAPWVSAGQMRAVRPTKYRLDVPIVLATPTAGKPNRAAEAFCNDLRRANAVISASLSGWPKAMRA